MSQRRADRLRRAMIVVALAMASLPAGSALGAASEAQIKAAYLYKLASFVRWPPSAFAEPDAPLRICVAGRNDVHAVLVALSRGQEASGRMLVAEAVDGARPDAGSACHILFVGQGETANRALLVQTAGRPVLTVTDRSAGTRGGIIEFVVAGGTIRFLIHRRAAEARQLVLSSKLLAVATSVEP